MILHLSGLELCLFLAHHHSDPDYSRVGKRGGTWPGLVEASPRDLMAEQGGGGGGPLPHGGAEVWEPVEPRPLLTLLPR